jgi:hypothetical protein
LIQETPVTEMLCISLSISGKILTQGLAYFCVPGMA